MRFSKRSLEGEFLIDHRASPGLTAEQVQGFGPAVSGGEVLELPLVTCAHCQGAVVLNPDRVRPRGYCAKCDKYLCDGCDAEMHLSLECKSAQRRIEQAYEEIERGVSPLLLTKI